MSHSIKGQEHLYCRACKRQYESIFGNNCWCQRCAYGVNSLFNLKKQDDEILSLNLEITKLQRQTRKLQEWFEQLR